MCGQPEPLFVGAPEGRDAQIRRKCESRASWQLDRPDLSPRPRCATLRLPANTARPSFSDKPEERLYRAHLSLGTFEDPQRFQGTISSRRSTPRS
jgi:hypothetical protein